MNEVLNIVLSFIGGLLMGILFFGGLWLTVKRLPLSKMPALLVLSSFLFRVGLVLIGFYFIGTGNWQRVLICMLGFIVARFLIISITKSIDEKKLQLRKEAGHET